MYQTIFIVLVIWLLINVMFVVVMMPPRKPRRMSNPNNVGMLQRETTGERVAPPEMRDDLGDELPTLPLVLASVVMAALFSLAPVISQVGDMLSGLFNKRS